MTTPIAQTFIIDAKDLEIIFYAEGPSRALIPNGTITIHNDTPTILNYEGESEENPALIRAITPEICEILQKAKLEGWRIRINLASNQNIISVGILKYTG